jgi:predicted exporter
MARLLEAFAARRGAAAVLCLLLTLAAVPGFWRLGFEEDLTAMFPDDFSEVRAFATYGDAFGGSDSLMLVLESDEGRDHLLAAGDALARELQARVPDGTVRHRLDAATQTFMQETLLSNMFLYLTPAEMAEARTILTPDGIRAGIAEAEARLDSAVSVAAEEEFLQDPTGLFGRVFLPLYRRTAGRTVDVDSGAALSRDGRTLLVSIEGTRHARDVPYARTIIAHADAAMAAVRDQLQAAGRPHDAAALRVTRAGGYLAAVVNERSIKFDMILTSFTSVAAVLLLFTFAFPPLWRGGDARVGGSRLGRLLAPHLLVMIPLGLGVVWTAGLAGYVLGHVTIITAGFIAVLVGLSVDFPIHLLSRYRDARVSQPPTAALGTALRTTGPGVVAAALTTAGGFAVLGGSRFRALAEMGGLTAAGLCFCLIAVLATAAVLYPRVHTAHTVPLRRWVARVGGMSRRTAVVVLAGATVLTGVLAAGPAVRGLGFEEDVRRLATPNAEARTAQATLGRAFGIALDPILLLTHGTDADAVAAEAARIGEAIIPLQASGAAGLSFGPGTFCPSPERVRANADALAGVDPAAVVRTVRAELAAREFELPEFEPALERLEQMLTGSKRGALSPALLRTQPGVWSRVARRHEGRELAALLVQPGGGADRDALVAAIESVLDAHGPNTRVATIRKIVDRLQAELIPEARWIGLGAAITVLCLALAHFRHLGWALAALIPVVLGLTWTLGAMAWLGWPLTFFNVCAGPLILGMGVDDGIHLVVRFREPDRPHARAALATVGVPVVLTTCTTMFGFGSLTLAGNGGLASLGWAAGLGVAACLGATLGPLSAILVLARPGGEDTPVSSLSDA